MTGWAGWLLGLLAGRSVSCVDDDDAKRAAAKRASTRMALERERTAKRQEHVEKAAVELDEDDDIAKLSLKVSLCF